MEFLWGGIKEAFNLWIHGDSEIIEITLRTLAISLVATAIALGIGIPLGAFLALRQFPGRRLVVALVNTGMGMPPVVVGLVVAVMLWRSGPLGGLGLIFTPTTIVIAQFLIAVPLVIGFSLASIQSLNPRLLDQIVALGASRLQLLWLEMAEEVMFDGILPSVGGRESTIRHVPTMAPWRARRARGPRPRPRLPSPEPSLVATSALWFCDLVHSCRGSYRVIGRSPVAPDLLSWFTREIVKRIVVRNCEELHRQACPNVL